MKDKFKQYMKQFNLTKEKELELEEHFLNRNAFTEKQRVAEINIVKLRKMFFNKIDTTEENFYNPLYDEAIKWIGPTNNMGYGHYVIRWDEKYYRTTTFAAHIVASRIYTGKWPKYGWVIGHKVKKTNYERNNVNPRHFREVTLKQNALERSKKNKRLISKEERDKIFYYYFFTDLSHREITKKLNLVEEQVKYALSGIRIHEHEKRYIENINLCFELDRLGAPINEIVATVGFNQNKVEKLLKGRILTAMIRNAK